MEVEDNPDDVGLEEMSEVDSSDLKSRIETGTGKRYRQASDVFIAEGFYTDCDNLLKKFLALKTSTFEDFIEMWKEKKIASVFTGRETYAEMLEFSEETFTIAKSFILPPHSKVKRIGALYLMYGMYTQQPICGLVKFRFTPPEWSVILKFVENLKLHGFLDANYIFHKMCMDGAFLTVVTSREYGLERNYRKYLMPWPARDKELDPSSTFSLETLMGRVYRGSLKAMADKCLNKYNSMKQLLEASTESKFQGVPGTDEDLEHVMQTSIEDVIGSADALKSTRKVTNIGCGRKDLKNKAFEHHSRQKGSCLPEACSSQSSPQDIVEFQNDPEILPGSESDSDDSEFKLMVKPTSRRNSRKIKSEKLAKLKRNQVQNSAESSPRMRRSTRQALNQEIVSQSAYGAVSGALVTSKTPRRSFSKSTLEKVASDLAPQSCPFIEIDSASITRTLEGPCNDAAFVTPNNLSPNVELDMKSSPPNARSIQRKSPPTIPNISINQRADASSSTHHILDFTAEKPDSFEESSKSNRRSSPRGAKEDTINSTRGKRVRHKTASSRKKMKAVS